MSKKSIASLLLMLAGLGQAACASTPSQSLTAHELPVTKVVMYQSGVGYIERAGEFSKDELVLRIRPDQINDILKSLTVIDRANGRPVSISLPVDKLTLDELAQIPEQIRNGGIESLLFALRGAHVKVKSRARNITGRIVGVDGYVPAEQLLASELKQEPLAKLTLMTPSNTLEVLDIQDIRSVQLLDNHLANGLNKSLDIHLNDGDWQQIEVRIRMDSSKKRELAMSYIVNMPTWKPAYRLVLNENNEGVLQAWAVISNVTGSDWNGIQFSLVSGQPMSFNYDLYRPHFLARPDLSYVAPQSAMAPKLQHSGFAKQAVQKMAAPAELSMAEFKSRDLAGYGNSAKDDYLYEEEALMPSPKSMAMSSPSFEISADEMVNNFKEHASTQQIGAFDEYKLSSLLTVKDGETALVNLLQKTLSAVEARLFEFTHDDYSSLSLQTVQMQNTTGVALEAGPITIYRGSTFVGEGYISRTAKDATAYITFATESRLTQRMKSREYYDNPRVDYIQNGRISVRRDHKRVVSYEITSNIPETTTVLLQIPIQRSWKPVDFPDNHVVSDRHYTVPLTVEAQANAQIDLTLMQDSVNHFSLDSAVGIEALKALRLSPQSSVELKEQISAYIDNYEKLQPLNNELSQIEQRRKSLSEDQRSNAQSLKDLKDLKSASANKLREQIIVRQNMLETELTKLSTRMVELNIAISESKLSLQALERSLYYVQK